MKINIKICQGRNEIYIEGATAKEILEQLKDIEKLVTNMSSLADTGSFSPIHPNTVQLSEMPNELMVKFKPRNITDKIILMVYYLWKHNTKSVNAHDMRSIFDQAQEGQPRNWGAMMTNLVSKGFVAKTVKKDNIRAWAITNSGITHVESQILKKEAKEQK